MFEFIQIGLYAIVSVGSVCFIIAGVICGGAWTVGELRGDALERTKVLFAALGLCLIAAIGALVMLDRFSDDSPYQINVMYVDDDGNKIRLATGIFDSKAACSTERNTVQINSDNTVVFCSLLEEKKGE